jgi:hypothetical protein
MKYIIAFSVCSWITGFCNNTMTLPTQYDSWSDCVGAGGKLIQEFSIDMKNEIDKDKLYISYFCNENHTNETTTDSKPEQGKIPSSYFRS